MRVQITVILTLILALCHINTTRAQCGNLSTAFISANGSKAHSFGTKDVKAIRHTIDTDGNSIASVELRYGPTYTFRVDTVGSVEHEITDLSQYNIGDIYSVDTHETFSPQQFLNTFFDKNANEGKLYMMGAMACGRFMMAHPRAQIEVYNISYVSTDVDGSKVLLTERVCFPKDPTNNNALTINTVYLYNHFTQTWDGDAPTSGGTFHVNCGIVFRDFMVVMPDGLGFGSTKDRAQVFLDANNVARWHLDGLKAGIALGKSVNAPLSYNYTVVNAGASQGGAAALALQRYYDTQLSASERSEIPLGETRVFAGPYIPQYTVDKHATEDALVFPQLEPLLIQGCMLSHPEEFKNESGNYYDIKDYLSDLCYTYRCPQYDNMTFLEALESKKLDGTASATFMYIMCDMAPTFRKIISPDLFTPSGDLDYNCHKMQVLLKVLNESNLKDEWTPSKKVSLCHCTDDNIVPVKTTDEIYSHWVSKGCNNVTYDRIESSGYDHITSSWIWISAELTGLSMETVMALLKSMQ